MAIGEAAAAIDGSTLPWRNGRESSTAAVSSGRKINEAEALRAAATWSTPSIRLRGRSNACARWTAPAGSTTTIRSAPSGGDVMTILTHHAGSRQAAMAPYGRLLLTGDAR